MIRAPSFPKSLLVAARPQSGLGHVLDSLLRDALGVSGCVLFVGANQHEAINRLNQFRAGERAASNNKHPRFSNSLALNDFARAGDFLNGLETALTRAQWQTPSFIVFDASREHPLSPEDVWLQFLPQALDMFAAHFVTGTSSGGSGNDLPDAARFDAVWTITQWQPVNSIGQPLSKFHGEVELSIPDRAPIIFEQHAKNNVTFFKPKEVEHVGH